MVKHCVPIDPNLCLSLSLSLSLACFSPSLYPQETSLSPRRQIICSPSSGYWVIICSVPKACSHRVKSLPSSAGWRQSSVTSFSLVRESGRTGPGPQEGRWTLCCSADIICSRLRITTRVYPSSCSTQQRSINSYSMRIESLTEDVILTLKRETGNPSACLLTSLLVIGVYLGNNSDGMAWFINHLDWKGEVNLTLFGDSAWQKLNPDHLFLTLFGDSSCQKLNPDHVFLSHFCTLNCL